VHAAYNSKATDPWRLVTDLDDAEEVVSTYRRRWWIEIVFRDSKSEGPTPIRADFPHCSLCLYASVGPWHPCRSERCGQKSQGQYQNYPRPNVAVQRGLLLQA